MTPFGTTRTFRDVRYPVAIGGKADLEQAWNRGRGLRNHEHKPSRWCRAASAEGTGGPSQADRLPERAGLFAARARGQEVRMTADCAGAHPRNHGHRGYVRRSARRL